jgi:hypothetical protein
MNGVPEGWGWPPNFRAYEYATVDSADGATVTLRGRLRHTYDEGWHDWEHSPLAGDVRRPDAIRREHEYLRGLSGRGASEASTKNLELSTTGNIEIQSRGNSFDGSTWGRLPTSWSTTARSLQQKSSRTARRSSPSWRAAGSLCRSPPRRHGKGDAGANDVEMRQKDQGHSGHTRRSVAPAAAAERVRGYARWFPSLADPI